LTLATGDPPTVTCDTDEWRIYQTHCYTTLGPKYKESYDQITAMAGVADFGNLLTISSAEQLAFVMTIAKRVSMST